MENRPLLLGHRGVRGAKAPSENTLAAFDQAIAAGCDGFEFDLRLTADGEAVICHDEKTSGREIAALSAQELALPTLSHVLTRYQGLAFLDIELKVPGLERIVTGLLKKIPPARGFVVSSFLVEVIESLHRINEKIPLGLICEDGGELSLWQDLPIAYVIPHHRLVRGDIVQRLKAAKKKVLVWTVNLPAEMKRLSKLDIEGIISDNPKRLVRNLRPECDTNRQI